MTILPSIAMYLRQYQRHTKTTDDGAKIIYTPGRGIVDIYTGSGWKKHSRYRLVKGHWVYLSGRVLAEEWVIANVYASK